MNWRRKIWTLSWRLVVCALLLAWIFHTIFLREGAMALQSQGEDWNQLSRWQQWRNAWYYGPRALWQTLNQIPLIAFGLSLFWMGTTILLGVLRWRKVLAVQGLQLPFGRTLEISLVAHFFNSFLLGSTGGDLLKAYYAARETHHKKTEAVVTVFVDRLMGLSTMLLFACLTMLINLNLMFSDQRLISVGALILGMFAGCSLIVGLAFWGGLSQRWPQARGWLKRLPKGELLERSLISCRRFGHEPGFLIRVMSISMALNLACVMQIWTLSWGLNLGVSPLVLLAIVPMIISISALPITPNGLGVRENLFVLMLAAPAIGVVSTKALSLSLLAYAGSLSWSLIGGVVYLTLKERHHLSEIAHSEEDATVEKA